MWGLVRSETIAGARKPVLGSFEAHNPLVP